MYPCKVKPCRDFLFTVNDGSSAKQKRNTPQTCQSDDCVNKAAEQGTLSAKQPGNQIELKNTNQSPVQTTDDRKNQCQRVHNFTSVLPLDRIIVPISERNIQSLKVSIAKFVDLGYNEPNTCIKSL